MFADWDVGFNNYTKNRGTIDPSNNLIYQYEEGGAVDPNYYGIAAFSGLTGGRLSSLNWETATEINNRGFEVERRSAEGEYQAVAFIDGKGTT